ncbi:type I iodothyronine deiodinase isoform X2 [Phyllopteryx taeniolatus]|uniref:type I iodothyronine deiodinase isoform X2 n=1 Tax=Phyllopteryx taeniolatus TaxID=161469 RepID=UPI002AD4E1D5|nr:type I iodothyronine deiodinase isoform X2 [Phyllopteryx taeniolatus]
MFVQKVLLYVRTGSMLLYVLCWNVVLRAVHLISPALAKKAILKMNERTTMNKNPSFTYDDWGPTFLTHAFVKTAAGHMWASLGQKAFVGGRAPDSPVVSMDEQQSSICNFFNDGWAFTNNIRIRKHRSLEDRMAAAQILIREDPLCPVVVDQMSNTASAEYGALPERLYVLREGKVLYEGGMGPWGYSPQEVRSVLEKMK